MGERSPGGSPRAAAVPDGRLDSWKEIAAYLNRDVTTVQRWERREGMPVRRHLHDRLGSVYAYRSEVDAWTCSRTATVERRPGSGPLNARNGPTGVPTATDPRAPSTEPATSSWALRTVRPGTLVVMAGAAALVVALLATGWMLETRDYFWRDPLAHAQFRTLTDFGTGMAATLSRDGRFVAFLSDRDGRMDVWITHVGTGRFYNLTDGRVPELVNPSVRTLGFSPDGGLVTFWARGASPSDPNAIGIWAVPTLGGRPQPYLERVAEHDWSEDGSRLVYHTPGPGDPIFVTTPGSRTAARLLHTAAAGLHAHYPVWAPNAGLVYFVQGSLPDAMDIWRIGLAGEAADRITHHNGRVSHPVLLDRRTLLYLATDPDGSGPWLYGMDVQRRVPHRVGAGADRYASLAASSDGRRLVTTVAYTRGTLWRMPVEDSPVDASAAAPIPLTTRRGSAPRLGPGYLLWVSSNGTSDAIWKLANGATTQLWSGRDARIIGGPSISPDGARVTFAVHDQGESRLYVMNADGTNARVVNDTLGLSGEPAWSPDGASIAAGAEVEGTPRLFRIALDGAVAGPLGRDYAVDPVWSPRGDCLFYSGADIGTTFPVKVVSARGGPCRVPPLRLTRGARRLRLLGGGRTLVVLRGGIQHKDLWLIDLETGAERRLTDLPPDFDVRDFDVAPDGREIVLERVQDLSGVVLIDLAPHE